METTFNITTNPVYGEIRRYLDANPELDRKATDSGAKKRVQTCIEALTEGVAHFWFFKLTGETREAFGTLNGEIIRRHEGDSDSREKKPGKALPNGAGGYVRYYDLEKEAFRQFDFMKLKEIDIEYSKLPEEKKPLPTEAPARQLSLF